MIGWLENGYTHVVDALAWRSESTHRAGEHTSISMDHLNFLTCDSGQLSQLSSTHMCI